MTRNGQISCGSAQICSWSGAPRSRLRSGRGGQVIKRIGVRARREIEELIGKKAHLELWVKVEPRWAKHPKRLKSLGYS